MAPPLGFGSSPTAVDTAVAALSTLAAIAGTNDHASSPTAPASAAPSSKATIAEAITPGTGDCQLLGSFALVVQAALGALALLALVYKRWRERPQRPVKIWFFDVSKQVFGSVLVHIANVFMSMLTSGRFTVQVDPAAAAAGAHARRWLTGRDEYTPNPCSFYLLNLAIDTTIGIPILIGLLKVTTLIVSYTPFGQPAASIQSGYYGNPPNAWWWLKQSLLYFCGLFGMKLVVLLIFIVFPWISQVGDWALRWTEGNEQLQIVFVMMLFPLIMNAMQYYIIDSFIKKPLEPEEAAFSSVPDDDWAAENGGTRGVASPYDIDAAGLLDSDSEDDDSGDSLRLQKSDSSARVVPRGDRGGRGGNATVGGEVTATEYDPELDGDAPTIIGSSSSSRRRSSRGSLPTELYPKE